MKTNINSSIPQLGYETDKNNQRQLCFDSHFLSDIASQFGSPIYIYSEKQIISQYQKLQTEFKLLKHTKVDIHFATKSNDRLAILNIFKNLNCGFDIVSGGELARTLKIGATGDHLVFSGVGKTIQEIEMALQFNVSSINVESLDELLTIIEVAQTNNKKAKVSLRVNPDIDAKTHPYISTGLKSNKFGIDLKSAFEIYRQFKNHPQIQWVGVSSHIGSQITDLSAFEQSAKKIANFVQELEKIQINLKTINLGGGIGIDYQNEQTIPESSFAQMVDGVFKAMTQTLIIEPGRYLVAKAGILLTQVLYLKSNENYHFAIADASMSELARPSLYQAYHQILPVFVKNIKPKNWQIVGPVCESSDVLGANRNLAIEKNDLLAITHTGAYGSVMSNNYNCRVKPLEVLITQDGAIKAISKKQNYADLLNMEIF